MESIHDAPGVDRRRAPPRRQDAASADRSTAPTRFQTVARSGPPLLSRHSSAFANGSGRLPLPEQRSSPEAIAAGERRPRWRRVPTEPSHHDAFRTKCRWHRQAAASGDREPVTPRSQVKPLQSPFFVCDRLVPPHVAASTMILWPIRSLVTSSSCFPRTTRRRVGC